MGISSSETLSIFNDKILFQKKLTSICKGERDKEDNMIYCITCAEKEQYIKINSFTDNIATLGIAVDDTQEVLQRNIIMNERDYDALSNLYNRRAFMRESEELFLNKKNLKIACRLMADMTMYCAKHKKEGKRKILTF